MPSGWLALAADARLGPSVSRAAGAGETLTVESLGDASAMSRATYARHFRERAGMSVGAFVAQIRMMRVRAAAGHAARAGGNGQAVGYQSEAAFGKAFRAVLGTTPGRWRRRSAACKTASAAVVARAKAATMRETQFNENDFEQKEREGKAMNQTTIQQPSFAFVAASWAALLAGFAAFLIGLWNAGMQLNEKGYYFTVLVFGLYAAISLQKSVRDRAEGIPVTGIYYGLSWIALLLSIALLVVGLFNATLQLSEKGFYAMSFVLALFGSVAVQKNTRDLQNAKPRYPDAESAPSVQE